MFKTTVGSLYNKSDRKEAARLVASGEVVGIFNRGVCALWFDGANADSIKKIAIIKGEQRQTKAVALSLDLEEFIPLIDMNKLPSKVKKFLLDPNLKEKIGSLTFIRAPLKADYQKKIPQFAKTFTEEGIAMIQNWDSFGHNPTEQFLKRIKSLKVSHPAVTSMNETGKLEIVDQIEAEKFCQDKKIPIFLKDLKAHPQHKGSYTIISLDKDGIRLQRDGNIPGWIIEQILGVKLIKDNMRLSKYPQFKFPKYIKNLPADQIRKEVLQYIRYA